MEKTEIESRLIVVLILFLLLPIISTIMTVYFGIIFTKSPGDGFHYYFGIANMLPYALFQAPFCLILAIFFKSKFLPQVNKRNRINIVSVSFWGAIVAVISGLIASLITIVYAKYVNALEVPFFPMFVVNYYQYYLNSGFSILSGIFVGVFSRKLST